MALPSNTKRKIFDGRYEVLSIVGRGTDSVVYHARHVQGTQQEVALKVLLNHKSQGSLSERLRKEALTLVSCRHKYVVRLDDFHSVDDLCYLSMEFAPMGDMRKVLTGLGTALPADRAAAYLRQCLEALDFIHATGVIHRDIKLDNILVLSDKEIRLADFGLALLPGDEVDIEELKSGAGSFSYLPPELVEGIRYDERSDLYSLGLCFYEALAGFHPFDTLPMAEQLEARKDGKIPALHEIQPGVPLHLSSVIAKLLRYDAEDRFRTALDAVRALDNPSFSADGAAPSQAAIAAAPAASVAEPIASSFAPSMASSTDGSAAIDTAGSDFDVLIDDPFADTPESAEPTEPAPKPAQRVPQPTEEIDLERIKEIIAKDSEQKAATLARRSSVEKSQPKAPPQAPERYSLKPKPETTRSKRAPASTAAASGSLATIRRLVSVGLGAAALTVISVGLIQYAPSLSLSSLTGLFGKGQETQSNTKPATEPSVPELPADFDASIDPSSLGFPMIPGGLYSGGIEGVIPGVRSPLALISIPKKAEVAVIVGIDGWAPTVSSALEEGATDSHTLVVRSSGVILNLTGELSGDAITGTFINTMTGESGTWSVRKIS